MQNILLEYLTSHWDKNRAKSIVFSPVPKGKTGDLALSFFDLAKQEKATPPALTKEVQSILDKADFIEKSEINGPYLNVFFRTEDFFRTVLQTPLQVGVQKGKSIVLEFSGPNTNKPLHLGHMRNHALGISMANILEQCGAAVHRVNIINDRGVHICKSMLAYQRFGDGETPENTGENGDMFVGRYYVQYETEAKKNPALAEELNVMLQKWEEGDREIRALWKKMNDWTLSGHTETYARQGITFEKSYYESETYLLGKEIAQDGLKKNVFQKRKDGAIVIDLTEEGLDEKVILRADGTSIYLTQDLAVASLREKDFTPDEMIYVVADEQNYHFQVLFLCLEKLGVIPQDHLYHLSYGLVNLPEGRMKSREGTVVDADNLMDELHEMAKKEIQKRNPDFSDKQVYTTAEQIMNAAWKFYLLTTSPRKTITFDPKASLQFEGATGPYLQYAGVRLRSIFEKAKTKGLSLSEDISVVALTETEKPLGRKILEYPHILERAAEQYNPTYLVTYLLELAQEWSRYYAEHSVLNADTEQQKIARLLLAQKIFKTLESGLNILGIEIPEKM